MATAKKKTGRKLGRPTNAARAAKQVSMFENLLAVVGAAASSAAQGAVQAAMRDGTLGTVTTIGSMSGVKASTATKQTGAKKAPGRNPDPTSNRFKARAMYHELKGKMPRNEIVNSIVEKLGLKKNVANTYYHEAERDAGDKPAGRRPATKTVAKKKAA